MERAHSYLGGKSRSRRKAAFLSVTILHPSLQQERDVLPTTVLCSQAKMPSPAYSWLSPSACLLPGSRACPRPRQMAVGGGVGVGNPTWHPATLSIRRSLLSCVTPECELISGQAFASLICAISARAHGTHGPAWGRHSIPHPCVFVDRFCL